MWIHVCIYIYIYIYIYTCTCQHCPPTTAHFRPPGPVAGRGRRPPECRKPRTLESKSLGDSISIANIQMI